MIDNKRCVLIVDDEIKLLRVIKDFLTIKNFHVLEAKDGEEAVNMYSKFSNEIDLILLDVMMPKLDGYSVLNNIRKSSSVPVIMLTAKGQEYDEVKGFNLGADDYIVKPFSPALLIARIEAVLKRSIKSNDSILKSGNITLDTTKRTVMLNNEYIELTRREFDLLSYLILNKGIALSREQLLDKVWGYDFDGDIRTVDTHIKQLRNKLNSDGSFIKTVHRIGYKFEDTL